MNDRLSEIFRTATGDSHDPVASGVLRSGHADRRCHELIVELGRNGIGLVGEAEGERRELFQLSHDTIEEFERGRRPGENERICRWVIPFENVLLLHGVIQPVDQFVFTRRQELRVKRHGDRWRSTYFSNVKINAWNLYSQ